MRLTPEQIKKIIETASPDLTVSEIAYSCGLKWTQVIPVLNRRKIKYKPVRKGSGNFKVTNNEAIKEGFFTWEWAEAVDHLFKRA